MITEFHKKITNNNAVLVLGEDHQGAWANTKDTNEALDEIVAWFTEKKFPVTCWHEGEDEPSPSFENFMKYFKKKYSGVRTEVKSWEPPFSSVANREEGLVVSLLAGDAVQFQKHLGRGVFIDELLKKKSWLPSGYQTPTRKEIEDIVSKGIYATRYLELLKQKITRPVLDEWFDLREEAFENPSSKLYKLMDGPQEKRERKVSVKMKSKSGIYLIGESHIPDMRKRGLLP